MTYWLTAVGELIVALLIGGAIYSAISSLETIATELKAIRLKLYGKESGDEELVEFATCPMCQQVKEVTGSFVMFDGQKVCSDCIRPQVQTK